MHTIKGSALYLTQFVGDKAPFDDFAGSSGDVNALKILMNI